MGWRDAPVVGQQSTTPAWQRAPQVGGRSSGPAPRESMRAPQMAEGPAGGAPPQTLEGPQGTRRETPRTLSEGVQRAKEVGIGAGEVGLTLATGGGAEVLAGLAGIEEFVRGDDESAERAAERIERVRNLRTFQPRTETGQQMLEGLSVPFQALSEGADRLGGATLDLTGSPLAATAVSTAIEAAPMAAGARTPRFIPGNQRQADINRVEGAAREQGVNLNAGVPEQRQQIARAGERMAPGARGDASEGVQRGLIRAREEARADRNRLYEQARSMRAGVSSEQVAQLPDLMQRATRDFLIEDMPRARKLLSRLETAKDLPSGSVVQLRALDDWRRMVNRNRPSSPDERAALGVMKAELDNWMDTMFDTDMIRGDPAAVAKWQEARRAHKSYKERFSDNRVIRNLTEMEADPTQVRNWIFGASATGAKSEATSVVKRIKSELGEDSPEFTALRQDAVLDIIDPLLQPEPNLRQYIRNYDRFVGKRPDLARELLGGNKQGMDNLRDLAEAHMRRPISTLSELPGGARFLSVAAFGHQLAKGALRRAAGEAAINTLRRATGISAKRRMMGEMLGYDPFAPMFRARMPAIGGATQELANPQQEQNQQPRGPQIPTPRAAP